MLIRTDGAGGTHEFLTWLTSQRLQYSVGFSLNLDTVAKLELIPQSAWTPAYDADRQPRDGAWVTELTGLLDLSGWPDGMRVIVRAERPHPGAQLRFTDSNGNRLTAFATNTNRGQLPDLELRHRRRARCEDRIRNTKDTGLRNLPLHDFSQNQIWIAVVMLATELTAWMQMLALTGTDARVWEPKRLRLRLFSIAGSIARRSRRTWLHLSAHAPHGQPRHHRPDPPASTPTTGLTRPNTPPTSTKPITGKWNPAPTQATPGPQTYPATERRPEDDLDGTDGTTTRVAHERSRLGIGGVRGCFRHWRDPLGGRRFRAQSAAHSKGKTTLVVALAAALLVGGAAYLVGWFNDRGKEVSAPLLTATPAVDAPASTEF